MSVGNHSVIDWEALSVDREKDNSPGVSRRNRGRLRVGRDAEMGHLATAPALTATQVLRQANAIQGHTALGSGISGRTILAANAQGVCQADIVPFVITEYDLIWDDNVSESEVEQGHTATTPIMGNTPSITAVPATQGHTATQASTLVGHIFAVGSPTQGYTVPLIPGFANRSQGVANGRMDHAANTVRLTKVVLPAAPQMGHTDTTVSLQRVYSLGSTNPSQGHTATPSGVTTTGPITPVAATQGHTATPTTVVYLSRTFPEGATAGMIVTPPTMSQTIVQPETDTDNFIGSRLGGTGVNEITVGRFGTHPNSETVAFRFRADKTAAVSAVKILTKAGTGFYFGEAVLEARILRDDNTSLHLPVDSQRSGITTVGTEVTYTGTSAHVGAVSDRLTVSALAASALPLMTWSSGKPVLTKNNIYHLEIRNVHADAPNNYASITTLANVRQYPNFTQPGWPDSDLGSSTRNASGNWSASSTKTPIFSIVYDGDNHQGQTYRDVPISGQFVVNGPLNKVRQIIVPQTNLRVHTIGYRLGRQSGSQPLQVRLRRHSDNAVLASAASHFSNFPLITNQADPRAEHVWCHSTFVSSFSLLANVTAALEFETTANAEYRVYHLNGSPALGVSGQYWEGVSESTTDGVNWVATDASRGNDIPFYLRLGSAAPTPTCVNDSLTGLTIGSLYTVSAGQLILNDINPSGTSATSSLPLGTNQLTLHFANSASNCTAVVVTASQTIRVTAQATTGAFTYIAKDIYGQKSSARVTIDASSGSIDTPLRTIYSFNHGSILTSAIMAQYKCFGVGIMYQPAIDNDKNGIFDGETATYNSTDVGDGPFQISANYTKVISMDWENLSPGAYGIANPADWNFLATGYSGSAASRSAVDAAKVVYDHTKGDRPNAIWGFYGFPSVPTPRDFISGTAASRPLNAFKSIPGELVQYTDALFPRAYLNWVSGNSTTVNGQTGTANNMITRADLSATYNAIGEWVLEVNSRNGNPCLVYPFISRHYYGSTGYGTAGDPEWIYLHCRALANATFNGRKIDGLHIWDRGGDSDMTEAELKAIYQGLNGLSYDPSMPRP